MNTNYKFFPVQVDDLVKKGLVPPAKKKITRTTSVVQNYPGSHQSVNFGSSFDHSKSLTHIERERENALQLSRLKKSHRHGVRYKRDSAS